MSSYIHFVKIQDFWISLIYNYFQVFCGGILENLIKSACLIVINQIRKNVQILYIIVKCPISHAFILSYVLNLVNRVESRILNIYIKYYLMKIQVIIFNVRDLFSGCISIYNICSVILYLMQNENINTSFFYKNYRI